MQKERKDKDFIKKPIYPGGPKAMKDFIKSHLTYPAEALSGRIEGTVSLEYYVDHLGKVEDARVISGLGHGCDEEAIRLVRLLQFEVPKAYRRRVRFRKTLQIHFRLPKAPPQPSLQITYTFEPASKEQKPKEGGYSYEIEIR